MDVKCEYCGSMIPDDATHCPNCGGVNNNVNRAVDGTPKTIEELKQWYQERKLPPYEVTRFFIGINCKEPKAFGIYKDSNKFIVYKNKSDGSRTIRYSGTDEDYAVNEIYLKLKAEILNQKEHTVGNKKSSRGSSLNKTSNQTGIAKVLGVLGGLIGSIFLFNVATQMTPLLSIGGIVAFVLVFLVTSKIRAKHKSFSKILFLLLIGVFVVAIVLGARNYTPRYYTYRNTPYVWYNNDYYIYDDYSWSRVNSTEVPEDLSPVSSDNIPFTQDFTHSDYYSSWTDNINFDSSSNDHDYDWDSNDSWDSGYTDWDSDW